MKTYTSSLIDQLLDSISPVEQAKIDAKMQIALKIEEALKRKNWKKLDLLNALGKGNPSIVSKWLSGTHNFTIETIVELENALDIRLLHLEDEKEHITMAYHFDVSQKARATTNVDNLTTVFHSGGSKQSQTYGFSVQSNNLNTGLG